MMLILSHPTQLGLLHIKHAAKKLGVLYLSKRI